MGSVDSLGAMMRSAGVSAEVDVTDVEIPWPGIDAYLDYRLSMPSTAQVIDDVELRAELRRALGSLPPDALTWRPRVIVAVGRL